MLTHHLLGAMTLGKLLNLSGIQVFLKGFFLKDFSVKGYSNSFSTFIRTKMV